MKPGIYVGVRQKDSGELLEVSDCNSQVDAGTFDGPILYRSRADAVEALSDGAGEGAEELADVDLVFVTVSVGDVVPADSVDEAVAAATTSLTFGDEDEDEDLDDESE